MKNEFREPWRFWSKVERRDSGCWEWTGNVTRNGYGYGWNFLYPLGGHTRVYSHRHSYMQAHGEIPDGLQIDHLCRNKLCVNPDHLEAVTQQENMNRTRKAACSKGHEFTEENTYVSKQGTRTCRTCNRENQRKFHERHPGAMKEANDKRAMKKAGIASE